MDAPSENIETHCVGPGKLSSNDQLPLFCTIFFLKARLQVQFSEHGSTVELGDKELFGHPKIVP